MSAKRRLLANDSGASAIEFSLIASAFFILLFGVFELGYALYCGASVRWALETSARTLLLSPTTTQAQLKTAVISYLGDIPNSSSVAVTLATDTSDPTNKVMKATTAYSYPFSVPMLPSYTLQFNASVTVPAP
ncbi:MAG: TadE/TadG family type IV pilus assembly protein [Rhodospirillaceae bacterium]